jgi:hypothetical protein
MISKPTNHNLKLAKYFFEKSEITAMFNNYTFNHFLNVGLECFSDRTLKYIENNRNLPYFLLVNHPSLEFTDSVKIYIVSATDFGNIKNPTLQTKNKRLSLPNDAMSNINEYLGLSSSNATKLNTTKKRRFDEFNEVDGGRKFRKTKNKKHNKKNNKTHKKF